MKTFKRLLASLMVVVMVLTAAPLSGFAELELNLDWLDFTTKASAATYSGSCGDNLTWTLYDDGDFVISGTGAMDQHLDFDEAPWHSYRSLIKSVTIDNGVTSISPYTFYMCSNLTDVTISESVTSIGSGVFCGCTSLTSITIPGSVTSIGGYVFSGCDDLKTVYYNGTSEQWNSISKDSDILSGCDNCQLLFISDSGRLIFGTGKCGENLTWTLYDDGELVISGTGEMTDYSYSGNTPWYEYYQSIKTVTVEDGVTTIGSNVFEDFYSLESVTIGTSVISIGENAFRCCDSLTNVTIGNSVTSIGQTAFYQCSSLTTITIPDSVRSIENAAFGSTGITSIIIPAGVTYLDDRAFMNNKNLTVYYCGSKEQMDTVLSSDTASFYNSFGFVIVYNYNPEQPTLSTGTCGENLTWSFDIETEEFVISGTGAMTDYLDLWDIPWYIYLSSINKIIISDGITSIGNWAFCGCKSLGSVEIADTVTAIGIEAFANCKKITNVAIPNGVKLIGNKAFRACTSLESVTIPDSVTSIGYGAFSGCDSLETVYYNGTSEQWNKIEIDSENDSLLNAEIIFLVTGREVVASGECGDNLTWTLYEDGELIISGTGEMTNYLSSSDVPWYDYHSSIKKVTIEDGVTSIGDYAFDGCSGLASITIPDSVTRIGASAFYCCHSLTGVTIPDSVTDIGDSAFLECSGLTSVTIPDGVKSIGSNVFLYCTNLVVVSIGSGVTSIGNTAFVFCPNLERVIFRGTGYITLGEQLFEQSSKAMICCEESSYMHYYADANNLKVCFLDDNGVPSFEMKNDILLSYRGESTDVLISTGTKIGYGAFENNSVIETVVLSSSVYLIYANAFKNCASLTTVIIPESVTSIGAGAFDGCDNLTIWCYAGSYADTYAVANGIDVEYIALDIEKDILILTLSGTSSLTASLNTPYAENSGIVWSSTNTSIATVDGNGVVKGVKAGTAVIVATSKEGGLRDYCVVKIVGVEAKSSAVIDHENGTIMGLSSNLDSLDGYVEISDPAYNLSYDSLGTDSVIYVECDGEIVDAYTVIIFGDVNGDGWYDGQDAIIVDCLANGMLTKDDVSEAVYMAADCNHDRVIDQLDVDLLNQAGTLLANVDQSKPTEVLLETSSAYVEYLDLIDQYFEIEVKDEMDTEIDNDVETEETPEADADTTPEQDETVENASFIEMIMNIIKSIFEMILSYIPVPLK